MKQYKVYWTRQATIDLDQIINYILVDNRKAALSIYSNPSGLRDELVYETPTKGWLLRSKSRGGDTKRSKNNQPSRSEDKKKLIARIFYITPNYH